MYSKISPKGPERTGWDAMDTRRAHNDAGCSTSFYIAPCMIVTLFETTSLSSDLMDPCFPTLKAISKQCGLIVCEITNAAVIIGHSLFASSCSCKALGSPRFIMIALSSLEKSY